MSRLPASSFTFYFSIFMLSIYVLLAFVILAYQWPAELPQTNRLILASALILYSAYRVYRLVKQRKEEI